MTALLLVTLTCALAVMVLLWAFSVRLRDASIVDIWWGPGFVLIVWIAFTIGEGWEPRRLMLAAMTTLWGLRLGWHIGSRNLGHGEDFRYAAMRAGWGDRFVWVSLFTVFLLQGTLQWLISLPLQVASVGQQPAATSWWDALGLAVWAIGLAFETVGDLQLRRFKADPANKGRILDRGLWRYTRHPNYFGDALVWWGLWLVAAASPAARWTVFSPLLMTWLLVRVSGVALLESTMSQRPGYAEYVARTSAFLPRPPR